MSTTQQFTALLPNDVLARIERMRLSPVKRLTNRQRGEHMSHKGGASIDFADFRDYVAGDDLRHVDWNIFSRLNQPYLKLYAHEENSHCVLILDASASMAFEGKFQLARQLAAALGVMGLVNAERVSVYSCSGASSSEPMMFAPSTGRASFRRFFSFLEGLEAGGNCPVESAIEMALRRHRGRGIAIVISDFMTFGDVTRPFNLLHASGLEVCGIQVLGPSEIQPELNGDLRIVDSETGQTIDISSAGELLGLYHQHRLALEQHLTEQCQKRNGRFLSVNSAEPVKSVLMDSMLRRGWIR